MHLKYNKIVLISIFTYFLNEKNVLKKCIVVLLECFLFYSYESMLLPYQKYNH